MAQASLAFTGSPDVALDRVRFVFEGIRNPEEREIYEKAFPLGVKASQFLLPWTLFDQLARESGVRMRFSTFHCLWLISLFLKEHFQVPEHAFFSSQLTERL